MLTLLVFLGCGAKTPDAVEAPVAEAPAPAPTEKVWSTRVVDAKTRPEPLVSVMRDVYDVRLLIAATQGKDGLGLMVAPALPDGRQDPCGELTVTATKPASDGSFRAEVPRLGIRADGFSSALEQAVVSGTWKDGVLEVQSVDGRIDTRPFLPRMGSNLAPDAICNLLPALGPCVPCEDGGAFCWNVGVDGLVLQPSSTTIQVSPEGCASGS